jgi:hypothetical protein
MAVMTVKQLIERLSYANPNMPVVVECENGYDPHPVAAVLLMAGGDTESMTAHSHVVLIQDTGADFKRKTPKD